MLYLKLCKPMILDVQIPEIAKAYKLDESDLMKVLNCSAGYFYTEDGLLSDRPMTPQEIKETGYDESSYIDGSSAIIRKCNEVGQPFESAVTEIEVPVEFYSESCKIVWDSVCYLFARVERQNSKLRTVLKINAPSIIQRNEERMLRKYLEELEHNHCHEKDRRDVCLKDDNGMIFRSLNDGGFSMIHGWDKEILEKREKEFQEFMQEENMTESEAEKYKPIFMDDGCTKDGE